MYEEEGQPDASANVGPAARHGTSLTLGKMNSRLLAPLSLLLLLLLAGCETGSAVVITPKMAATPSTDASMLAAVRAVAARLDMRVEGPITGPGSDVSYNLVPEKKEKKYGYFLFFTISERREIVIRTLLPNAPKEWADEPIRLLEDELSARGLAFDIHRT